MSLRTVWTFNADGNAGAVVDGISSKVSALDANVRRQSAGFQAGMAGNARSAMGLGDAIEEVAGRVHPALGALASQALRVGQGVMSAFKAVPSNSPLNSSLLNLGGLTRSAGSGVSGLKQAVSGLAAPAEGAASGMMGMAGSVARLGGPEGAAAVAVIGALVAVMATATSEAAQFSHTFRQLSNLNLDKPREEVARLRAEVLDVSFDQGIDPEAMSRAYFDIQSITGKYGREVESMAGKVAEFSKAYIVDVNKMAEGAAQASKTFKLDNDGVDAYLASTVKTVQVGKTTFEQLAQVRSEYFDSAAGAGFDFMDADKIFAAYSVGAKSVDIAANQVKETFRGLSDANVLKGLKAQGVEVFDPTTHKIRAMQDIVGDLAKTFSTTRMSDEAFAKIKGSIGGGDGIAMLLNKARAMGEGFVDVFRQFDAAPVNMQRALEGAKGDLMTMWETTKARLSVSLIKLGTEILPHITKALDFANEVMKAFNGHTEGIGTHAKIVVAVFKGLGALVWFEFQKIKLAIEIALAPIWAVMKAASWVAGKGQQAWDWATGRDRDAEARQERLGKTRQQAAFRVSEEVGLLKGTDAYKSGDANKVLDAIVASKRGTAEGTDMVINLGKPMARQAALAQIRYEMKVRASQPGDAAPEGLAGGGSPMQPGYLADWSEGKGKGRRGSSGSGSSTESISAGAGQAAKNITVNIQQLVGEINISATSQSKGMDITREVEAALVRSVRNAEATLD